MALGCAFIFLVIVWLWRRRARKQRQERTKLFAKQRQLDPVGWRWRLLRFGEKLFGHRASRRANPPPVISNPMGGEGEAMQMAKMRAAEEARDARDARDMDKLLANYEYPRSTRVGEVRVQHFHHHHLPREHGRHESTSTLSAPSLYSQVTGMPHRVPEPKEPVKDKSTGSSSRRDIITQSQSRFSTSTIDEYYLNPPPPPTTTTKSKNPFWR